MTWHSNFEHSSYSVKQLFLAHGCEFIKEESRLSDDERAEMTRLARYGMAHCKTREVLRDLFPARQFCTRLGDVIFSPDRHRISELMDLGKISDEGRVVQFAMTCHQRCD